MPKWLLFGLAAVINFVLAFVAYRGGRLLIPALLTVGGVCFVIAAAGSARGAGGARRG
jgi:hypothetical protein